MNIEFTGKIWFWHGPAPWFFVTVPAQSRLGSAFLKSLKYPSQAIDFTTTEVVQTRLQQAGFRDFSVTSVPHKDNLPWNIDWIMLEAKR